jgi:putative oxidoreductase
VSQLSSVSLDRGLLLVRLALGIVFIAHGWQKLAVYGVSGVATGFGQLGFPLPMLNAVLITAVELGGGLLLIAGAGTRIVGALLAFSMLVATLVVHRAAGFFLPNGYEFSLTLMLVSLALTQTGAGPLLGGRPPRRPRID